MSPYPKERKMTLFKKTLISLLAAVMLFTVLAPCGLFGGASAGETGVFSRLDELRDSLIAGEPGGYAALSQNFETRSVFAFRKDAPESLVCEKLALLSGYKPLSYTSQRVFVSASDRGYVKQICGDLLLYCVEDEQHEISLCAEDAPYEIAAVNASYSSAGGAGVVVAVLDSGVDRTRACFENAHILEGWDCVTDTAFVETDEVGHGTAICGIICAKDYGVAQGASVLPVRITADGRRIKTSDLVESVYYAADSGADIINMSFGGYIENAAESEAVAYAAEKGCILVSSAGNEGEDPEYAGKYSYPASFENVISVASFGENGKMCAFSQRNDKVDICAPGESLSVMLYTSPAGETGKVNGTSFSTAYVSGAAALCVEKRGEKINSYQFEKLLSYAASAPRDKERGWGNLDIEKLLACAGMPYVEGVCGGSVYFTEVSATFENCTALLDGEEYVSGDTVFSQGRHELTVTGALGEVTFVFDVDTLPLTYSTEKGEGFVSFVFDRGTAALDGKKYNSGDRVTREGSHVFTLTGPYGNTVGESFTISQILPAVSGVEPGGSYSAPREMIASGSGKTYLDGVEFSSRAYVRANGVHTVLVTDITGERTSSFDFELKNVRQDPAGYLPQGKAFFDLENGYVACWEPGGAAVTLFTPEDFTTPLRELTFEGAVIGLYCENDRVYAVHTRGYSVFDRDDMLFGSGSAGEYVPEGESIVSACVFEGAVFWVDESGAVLSSNENVPALDLGSRSSLVASNAQKVVAYSAYTPGTVYEYSGGGWHTYELACEPGFFGLAVSEYCVCVGGDIYTGDYGYAHFRLPENERIIAVRGERVITQDAVYSARTGEKTGVYETLVSYACFSGGEVAICGPDGAYRIAKADTLCGACRAADALTGEFAQTDDFTFGAELTEGVSVADALYDPASSALLVIIKNDNRLYYLDTSTGKLIKTAGLLGRPVSIAAYGETCAVLFDKSDKIYVSSTGEYISFPGAVNDVCTLGGAVYAVSESRLYRASVSGGGAQIVPLEPRVRQIEPCGEKLCVLGEEMLYLYDPASGALKAVSSTEFRPAFAVYGGHIFAGGDVYSAEGEFIANIGEFPRCAFEYSAFAETGVFRVSDGLRVSYSGVTGYKCAVTPRYGIISFDQKNIRMTACGGDVAREVEFTGVEDGGVYYDDVTAGAAFGKLYLDGESVEDGVVVSEPGKHTLRAVMPFNIERSVTFTLLKSARAVMLSSEEINLSPGQKVTLRATVSPAGAAGKITFTSSSPCVSVTAEGVLTAVSYGESVIRAADEYSGVYAECTVFVAENTLKFKNAAYSVDRDEGVVSGVAPRTFIIDFISSVLDCETAELLAPDGTPAHGTYVVTGMTLQKRDRQGKITDTLAVAVTGDADGDGIVTVCDMDILYSHLRGSKRQTGFVLTALDVNGNGKVTSSDLKALFALLGQGGGRQSSASVSAQAPDNVFAGGLYPVTLRAGDIGSVSLAGVLEFSAEDLEFVKAECEISEVFTELTPQGVRFCVPAVSRANDYLIRFWLRASEDIENASLRFTGLEYANGREVRSISDTAVSSPLSAPAAAFGIASRNSDLEFDSSVYSYDITVANGEKELLLEISCPAECRTYTSPAALAEDGITVITLIYETPAGRFEYTFRAKHGELRLPDTDSSLKAITVSGAALDPPFSPDITEYTVRHETDGAVSVAAQAQSACASVDTDISYGENRITYTFTCTAEDGSATVYTVNVVYTAGDAPDNPEPQSEPEPVSEPPEELSEEPVSQAEESVAGFVPEQSLPGEEGKSLSPLIVVIALGAVLALAAICAVIFKKRK